MDISVGHHCKIQVDDISSCGTRIEISCVPFSISNEQLSGMLRRYGEVFKCQNYHRSFGKYSKLNKTGDRIIWMDLKEQIPETLNICDTELSILSTTPNNHYRAINVDTQVTEQGAV